MGLISGIERFSYGVAELLGQPAGRYVRLETGAKSDQLGSVLVGDDGSLVTIIELRGHLRMFDSSRLAETITSLTQDIAPIFRDSGHHLQCVMRYDPDRAKEEVEDALRQQLVTARNIGMDMEDVLEDWQKEIARYCASERSWLVVWSRLFTLEKSEQKNANKDWTGSLLNLPFMYPSQRAGEPSPLMLDAHNTAVSGVTEALSRVNLLFEQLDAHDALWWIRYCLDPNVTSRHWRALLPGDPLPVRFEESETEVMLDLPAPAYPRIERQVLPRQPEDLSMSTVKIGDKIHCPVAMTMPPQTRHPFQKLFNTFIKARMPWQVSFFLDADGLGSQGWKDIITTILFFGQNNRRFGSAMKELKALEDAGTTVCKLQIMFDTWVNSYEKNVDRRIAERVSKLIGVIQSWGNADASEIIGDPWLGVAGTTPALMSGSPAPAAAAPLQEVIRMMPITRPSSPWSDGNLLLRTPDGKLFPYDQGSSKQASWIDVGIGPMGSSKSVWLNTLNLGFCLQAGLKELPPLGILDIGPSSSGLIDLLRAALPENRKHEAVYERLRMNPEKYSVNPCDTPLGMRYPTPSQLNFLVNLLTLMATPVGKDAPEEDGIPGLARKCVEMAYKEYSDHENPKPYTPGKDEQVDQVVETLNIAVDEETSWFEIADALMEQGEVHMATRAHRNAMPLIGDIATKAKSQAMQDLYDRAGSDVTTVFWRRIIESADAYPILCGVTTLDIGDSRVIALDLDEVCPKGGAEADRQTAVMYMIGRQIVAARMFMGEEDARLAPDLYVDYHLRRVKAVQEMDKRLSFDEFHRASRNEAVRKQFVADLETASRESRKWGLHMGIYSQTLEDIPEIICELATSIFMLGCGDKSLQDRMQQRFGLDRAAYLALGRLTKPSARGADMIAVFKTDDGNSIQLVTNTLGKMILWALDSTKENRNLRKKIYERLGVNEGLRRLAKAYPGGVKAEFKRRAGNVEEIGYGEDHDIMEDIAHEICAQAG